MNRTIKGPTVKRVHYESHNQLRRHLADYNFGRRLKTPDLRPDFLPIMRRVLG
jgi:hypothetical protein